MNNEQVMQIMADMGQHEGGMDNWVLNNFWVQFANLVEAAVRANEREACAKLADELFADVPAYSAPDCAAAIRARGAT